MKKLLIILSILSIAGSAYAGDYLTGFDDEKDLPILNEHLRKLDQEVLYGRLRTDDDDDSMGYLDSEILDITIIGEVVDGEIAGWEIGPTYLKSGETTTTVGLDSGGVNPAIYCGHATPASAPFKVTNAGAVTATSGTIGGWTLASDRLSAGTDADYIGLLPGTGIQMGDSTFADAEFSVTNAGVLKATSGTIGGWTLGATTLSSTNITIDSGNELIKSNDYVSGALGAGWQIDADQAEFNNIRARGILSSAVFEKTTISSVGGNFLVSDSDVLDADMTTDIKSDLTISGDVTFAKNDILRIKDGTNDEWLVIDDATSAPTYGVIRNLGDNELTNWNFETWTSGTSVAPDGWTLVGDGASIAREDTIVKIGTYSTAVTRSGTNCYIQQPIHAEKGIDYWKGKTVTFSAWVYATVATRAVLTIGDGVSQSNSSYHTGDSTWQLLTATRTIDASATYLTCYFQVAGGDTTAYIDGAICIEGDGTSTAWTKGTAVVNYGASGEGLIYMTASDTNSPHIDVLTHAGSPWDTTTTRMRMGNVNGFLGAATDLYGIYIGETDAYLKYDPTNGLNIKGIVLIEAGSTIEGLDATNVAGWASGSDATKIDGGDIYTNSITVSQLGTGIFGTDQLLDNGNFEDWSAGTSSAPDGWTLYGAGSSIARSATHKLGTYSVAVTRGGTNLLLYKDFISDYVKGRTFTLGCWVYATEGGTTLIRMRDSAVGDVNSSVHSGNSTWEWLTCTMTIDEASTYAYAECGAIKNSDTTSYFDGAMLVEGEYAVPFAEKVHNYGHPSDYTKIDGGDIYTNTVTATQISVSQLDAITVNTGTLTVDEYINAGSNVTIDGDNEVFKVFGDNITIETDVNDKLDWIEDANTEVATLTASTTYTPTTLAAHIQTIMRAQGDADTTVVYSSSTKKITIANSTLSTLTLKWSTGTNTATTCGRALGFDITADDSGALTYAADYQTALRVELGKLS